MILAAMRQHPSYAQIDMTSFKPLLDSLPSEPTSEMHKRKAAKCSNIVVNPSPAMIRAGRPTAEKRGVKFVAMCAMEELLIRWLIALPWRRKKHQRTSDQRAGAESIQGKDSALLRHRQT